MVIVVDPPTAVPTQWLVYKISLQPHQHLAMLPWLHSVTVLLWLRSINVAMVTVVDPPTAVPTQWPVYKISLRPHQHRPPCARHRRLSSTAYRSYLLTVFWDICYCSYNVFGIWILTCPGYNWLSLAYGIKIASETGITIQCCEFSGSVVVRKTCMIQYVLAELTREVCENGCV